METTQIQFTDTFALVRSPSGYWSIADVTEPGRYISIQAFLYQKWNPWTNEDKAALKEACIKAGIPCCRL